MVDFLKVGSRYWLTRFTGGGVQEPSITATFGQYART
jgi:hypothetical protein